MIEIHQHKVTNCNIINGISNLMENNLADLFYCDPPWGDGNIKYWETMNFKMNNEIIDHVNIDTFLQSLFGIIIKYTKNISFLEYGLKYKDLIISYIEKNNLILNGIVSPYYKSNNKLFKYNLYLISKSKIPIINSYLENLSKLQGYNLVIAAINPYVVEGGILLDPCYGLGNTARAAKFFKMKFYGNEINKSRLAKTIKILKG